MSAGKAQAWSNGQRPSADDLERIADKLGFSPSWLLLGQGDPMGRAPDAPYAEGGEDFAAQARSRAGETGSQGYTGHEYGASWWGKGGQEGTVRLSHPVSGVVTNPSRLPLGTERICEYVQAPEIRPYLSREGEPEITGPGLAVPRELAEGRHSMPNLRTVRLQHGWAVYDASATALVYGDCYIVYLGIGMEAREIRTIPGTVIWSDPFRAQEDWRTEMDDPRVRVLGRVVWLVRG